MVLSMVLNTVLNKVLNMVFEHGFDRTDFLKFTAAAFRDARGGQTATDATTDIRFGNRIIEKAKRLHINRRFLPSRADDAVEYY